jgi:hypothetical protein
MCFERVYQRFVSCLYVIALVSTQQADDEARCLLSEQTCDDVEPIYDPRNTFFDEGIQPTSLHAEISNLIDTSADD